MPPLLADFSHARACKPFCEKYLTLPILGMDFTKTAGKQKPLFPKGNSGFSLDDIWKG